MKVSTISSLVSGLSPLTSDTTRAAAEAKPEASAVAPLKASSEAARVSIDSPENPADRATRIADLKTKISAGEYRPDSREVAKSIARELFA